MGKKLYFILHRRSFKHYNELRYIGTYLYILYILTTHALSSKGIAETFQMFLRETLILPWWLSYEKYYSRDRFDLIERSLSQVWVLLTH
jgi:hypothetical protein